MSRKSPEGTSQESCAAPASLLSPGPGRRRGPSPKARGRGQQARSQRRVSRRAAPRPVAAQTLAERRIQPLCLLRPLFPTSCPALNPGSALPRGLCKHAAPAGVETGSVWALRGGVHAPLGGGWRWRPQPFQNQKPAAVGEKVCGHSRCSGGSPAKEVGSRAWKPR